MAKVGYIRVLTEESALDRQEEAIRPLVESLFADEGAEKDTSRPEFYKMMTSLKKGDVLYVESITRLAKSTRDLLQIIEALRLKDVDIVSFKEEIDTTNEDGRSIWKVFSALLEIDKQAMGDWQRDYIEAAKKRSKKASRQGF